MIKTFTENDLVRFIYNELSTTESEALKQTLIADSSMQQKLDELKSIHEDLEHSMRTPSDRVINRILEFSSNYHKQSV
ncbi:MAG: hypothetical protein ACI83W_000944 [Marinoscillum sp.]|jgi:hypothetical protein